MRRVLRVGVAVGLAGVVAASVASCLDPTQITLDVRTDVRCEFVRGLTIVGGRPGTVEGAAPTTETLRCLPSGEIGTLVATPKETKSDEVSFKVVMGVERPVADCKREDGYKGCIVQRRQLAFVPRTPITLPVYMLLVCVGVPCDENSTCAANGKCVPAKITDPERCVGSGCFPPGDPAGGPDASLPDPNDATTPQDGALSGDASDGGASDAPADAPGDGSPLDGGSDGGATGNDGGLGSLRDFACPAAAPPLCRPGQVCCVTGLDGGPYSMACLTKGGMCPPDGRAMECTHRDDCKAYGADYECCSVGSPQTFNARTVCLPFAQCQNDSVCQNPPQAADASVCPDNRSCDVTPARVEPTANWGTCGS